MQRFERDLHICSVFAVSEDLLPLSNPKIYVRSKLTLPAWDISLALKRHLQTFRKALDPKFRFRPVKEKVKESYSFLPNERRSAKQNALVILTTMEKWFYFCPPTNLAFHDLMIGKVAPRALQSLLGLGVNFCPTPLLPTLNIEKKSCSVLRGTCIFAASSP